MSIKDAFLKTNIQGIIALVIIVGGLCFLSFAKSTEAIQVSISNFIMVVLGYYFGSSRSGVEKDKTISEFLDKQN